MGYTPSTGKRVRSDLVVDVGDDFLLSKISFVGFTGATCELCRSSPGDPPPSTRGSASVFCSAQSDSGTSSPGESAGGLVMAAVNQLRGP